MTGRFDVITMGRVGVDVYPDEVGVSLADVTTFGKYLGGSPTNVAVAAARHGRRSAVVTAVGDDPFAEFVCRALHGFGVDDSFVQTKAGGQTPVTFCEMFPPDRFPLYFYRHAAPDLGIGPADLDLAAIGAARIFWFTGTGLSQEPSLSATMAALECRQSGRTIFDLDYRPMFWADPEMATERYRKALAHASVAVGNMEECAVATGETDPEAAALALLEHGVELAIVKRGPEGVLAAQRSRRGVEIVEQPPLSVRVVNGLGAGDSFGGALCHGLLDEWELPELLAFCNAAGAHVTTQVACADAMPTTDEVRRLMGEEEVSVHAR
ncbi:5-dehydro-2-deoxygluconokinase [Nocardioides sp. YIM 152315]|uniref:5-dehydro-2-deoxygluconokinase n=1 Tax=Nocardioides sp. YIM 152315 TaxID=3031760 RepID=UPI0023DC816E|nr:5-dehydro-2-deoxygluconokinase [Nocardioides sp. YIM 152315]MDF1605473.1 5-dehydro-2-deoxygluconokinase [Nocardioides sp. YIM 152315]